MNILKLAARLGCAALIVMCAGCAGEPEVYTVEGTVSYQGKPLPEDVSIFFTPVDGRRPSGGNTEADGRFKMRWTGMIDGAVPGEHIVHVEYIPPNEEGMAVLEGRAKVKGMMGEVLKKYGSSDKSDFHVTIDHNVDDLKIDLP